MEEFKPVSVRNVPAKLWERFVRCCRREGRSVTFMFIDMLIRFLKTKEK